ncbi:hypothetical protein [Candidatus Villigracilis saccharophilus]|uniref:hypothetical protein n=1 Tax=Candidatus Villigracilis saccharophilus TaxID=3140684 RepID=UPI0031352761|nr:hypothetical protein [Anaerolineales bacterium]
MPIAWSWVKHVRGHSTGKQQVRLLKCVRSLLPKGAPVFLVGDSEFGSIFVLRQLDQWRWFYVLRQKTNTGLWINAQLSWRELGSFVDHPGQTAWFQKACLTKKRDLSGVSLGLLADRREGTLVFGDQSAGPDFDGSLLSSSRVDRRNVRRLQKTWL